LLTWFVPMEVSLFHWDRLVCVWCRGVWPR